MGVVEIQELRSAEEPKLERNRLRWNCTRCSKVIRGYSDRCLLLCLLVTLEKRCVLSIMSSVVLRNNQSQSVGLINENGAYWLGDIIPEKIFQRHRVAAGLSLATFDVTSEIHNNVLDEFDFLCSYT